jgi:broad specificity phosphatase PhoE
LYGEDPAPPVYEDPRLREVEWGYDKPGDYDDYVDEMREIHGKFYFRMEGGESPADGYDRVSGFLETMMRQIRRKGVNNVLIVSHGLTIRCFAMRFMHLKVEQFDDILNPKHCDIVTITNERNVVTPQFTTGSWNIAGLRLPDDPGPKPWPWACPTCSHREVWPNMPNQQAQCESCSTIVEYSNWVS